MEKGRWNRDTPESEIMSELVPMHQDLAIGNYVFKRVDSFKYLGTMVNKMKKRSIEVNARLTMANRAYYGLQNHMKSRIISRNTKTLLYKTLIRPVLT